ncbi:MAG: FecR family protein [Solirubrobacterales bacterium]
MAVTGDEPSVEGAVEEAVRRFARIRAGEASATERRDFQAWLEADRRRQAEVARLDELWRDLDGLKARYAARRPARRAVRWRWAAAALVLLAVGATQVVSPFARTVATAKGETRAVTLDAGTTVYLNTESRITVAPGWPLRRTIVLDDGEALFDIHGAGGAPLSVRAGAAELRDIGTRFDVRSQAGGHLVAVFEGEVEVRQADTTRRLARGAAARIGEDGIIAGPAPGEASLTSWRNGSFTFDATPLTEVAAQINRYHDRPVTVASAEVGRLTVSGGFAIADRDGLLRTLETLLPIAVTRSEDGSVVLAPRGTASAPPRLLRQ